MIGEYMLNGVCVGRVADRVYGRRGHFRGRRGRGMHRAA